MDWKKRVKEEVSRVTSRFHSSGWMVTFTGAENIRVHVRFWKSINLFLYILNLRYSETSARRCQEAVVNVVLDLRVGSVNITN